MDPHIHVIVIPNGLLLFLFLLLQVLLTCPDSGHGTWRSRFWAVGFSSSHCSNAATTPAVFIAKSVSQLGSKTAGQRESTKSLGVYWFPYDVEHIISVMIKNFNFGTTNFHSIINRLMGTEIASQEYVDVKLYSTIQWERVNRTSRSTSSYFFIDTTLVLPFHSHSTLYSTSLVMCPYRCLFCNRPRSLMKN